MTSQIGYASMCKPDLQPAQRLGKFLRCSSSQAPADQAIPRLRGFFQRTLHRNLSQTAWTIPCLLWDLTYEQALHRGQDTSAFEPRPYGEGHWRITRQRLDFIQWNIGTQVFSDVIAIRAWIIHHLGIPPQICAIRPDQYQDLVHLEWDAEAPPAQPRNFAMPSQISIDLTQSGDDESLLLPNNKRQRCSPVQGSPMTRSRTRAATLDPDASTQDATQETSCPTISTYRDVGTQANFTQQENIVSAREVQFGQEMNLRALYNAAVATYEAEIRTLRVNEDRLLQGGLSGNMERDNLWETVAWRM